VQTVETTLVSAREGGPMRPSVFVGLRGMGKTALLRRCLALARADGAVVIALEASRETSMSEAFAQAIGEAKRSVSAGARVRDAVAGLRRILPAATYDLPNDLGKIEFALRAGSDTSPTLRRSLDELNDVVRRRGSYLVLGIDEIQEANVDELREVVMFVHASQGTVNPAVLIGAGLTNSAYRLHEARTYTERYRYPRIGRVGVDETKAAIAVPAAEHGVTFTDEALELLAAETGGYPFFIQEYASVVWTFSEGPTIGRDDVTARVAGRRSELDEQFYAPRFARLTDRECAYVLALADLGEGAHSVRAVAEVFGVSKTSELSSLRNQLIKKEVVFSSGPGAIEFRMPMTEEYIRRHRLALEQRAARSVFSQMRLG
jgi:hypothetical protein